MNGCYSIGFIADEDEVDRLYTAMRSRIWQEDSTGYVTEYTKGTVDLKAYWCTFLAFTTAKAVEGLPAMRLDRSINAK